MSQTSKSDSQINTAVVIAAPPFGQIDGKEAIDLALVCAAFEQQVTLIFVDEGIFHLVDAQHDGFFENKYHDKQLNALPYYEIEKVYAETESLQRFNLTADLLSNNVQTITRAEMNQRLSLQQHTISF